MVRTIPVLLFTFLIISTVTFLSPWTFLLMSTWVDKKCGTLQRLDLVFRRWSKSYWILCEIQMLKFSVGFPSSKPKVERIVCFSVSGNEVIAKKSLLLQLICVKKGLKLQLSMFMMLCLLVSSSLHCYFYA